MICVNRIYTPGSEWIYFKIYGGEKTLDKFLGNEIFQMTRKLNREGIILKWFFIRYGDPDFHLRIRFLISNESHFSKVVNLLREKTNHLLQCDLIWKIQLDTYSRELERYGDYLIEETETIFCIDSECAISCIRALNRIQNEEYRWMIAVKMIDSLLNDFGLNINVKKEMMEQLCISFKEEFGFTEFNSKQFNVKYRDNKKNVNFVIKNEINEKDFLKLCRFVRWRSVKMKPLIDKLNLKIKNDEYITLNYLLKSYLHMMLDRIFRSRNRVHEMILYDFLRRYYEGEGARTKYIPVIG